MDWFDHFGMTSTIFPNQNIWRKMKTGKARLLPSMFTCLWVRYVFGPERERSRCLLQIYSLFPCYRFGLYGSSKTVQLSNFFLNTLHLVVPSVFYNINNCAHLCRRSHRNPHSPGLEYGPPTSPALCASREMCSWTASRSRVRRIACTSTCTRPRWANM